MDTQVADLLGGERVLGASVKSNLDLARATRQGLPAETAVQLVEAFAGGEAIGPAARGPLEALIASLRDPVNRKKAGSAKANASPARLTPQQSDIVIRTASTLAKAIDTLGDREKAAHWPTVPNHAFARRINLLDTSPGTHEVEALLDRIEYGVYS
ncbi:MAG: antitoxin Xre/MbcA/ParS toxin-binding domain-containing protein [Bryobacteraceae bacterium]|jgi:putative toxin-antitoxin system antitoxin component (TIGR02293 family)